MKGGIRGVGKGVFRGGTYWGVFPVCERVTVMANGGRRRQPKRLGREEGEEEAIQKIVWGTEDPRSQLLSVRVSGPPQKFVYSTGFSRPPRISTPTSRKCVLYTLLYYCHLSFMQIHISLIEASKPPWPALNGTANTLECQTQHLPTAQACPSGYAKC